MRAVRVPLYRVYRPSLVLGLALRNIPRRRAAPERKVPQTHAAVVRARHEPATRRIDADTAHPHTLRVWVNDGRQRREGTQLLGRRKLRHERLWIREVDTLTAHARRKVQVETAFEALLDKVGVARHKAQRAVLGREETGLAVLRVGLVPLALLVFVEEVLGGRVV